MNSASGWDGRGGAWRPCPATSQPPRAGSGAGTPTGVQRECTRRKTVVVDDGAKSGHKPPRQRRRRWCGGSGTAGTAGVAKRASNRGGSPSAAHDARRSAPSIARAWEGVIPPKLHYLKKDFLARCNSCIANTPMKRRLDNFRVRGRLSGRAATVVDHGDRSHPDPRRSGPRTIVKSTSVLACFEPLVGPFFGLKKRNFCASSRSTPLDGL